MAGRPPSKTDSSDTLIAEHTTGFPMASIDSESCRPSSVEDGTLTDRNPRTSLEEHDLFTDRQAESGRDRDLEKNLDSTPKALRDGALSSASPPAKDPNLVEFDGPEDPENPQNFSTTRKWSMTIILALMTLTITFASSVFSTAIIVVSKEYDVSTEVGTLGVSLYVLGFALGPILWGPFSELYGRTIPLYIGFFMFAVFQIPVAVARNIETIMICRFLAGMCGCAPLTVVGGQLADIWDPVERGVAIAIFAGAVFIGPVAGPIGGGFITMSYLGWRWTQWISLIAAVGFGIPALFIVPETYVPILLVRRARRLRHSTKNWALHAKLEESQFRPRDIVTRYLLRPILMLVQEPILLLISIYQAFIYGLMYLFFEAYPISFQEMRGWNLGVGALPFAGIMLGVVLGACFIAYTTKTRFARKMREQGRVVPEERLVPMILGAVLLPIGLFWFAWTSSPHISWVPQVLAGVPMGAGVFMIFLQGLNYIIDVYLMNANSGIAANTFLRSLAGAGFPLFAVPMYHRMGVDWATSLLGFLAVAFMPVPVLFYIYGERLRKLSRFVPQL